ncbi:MAG: HAD hydrolase-like protein [Candidatus Neomarinimicrobiota bacterium]
MYKHIIWDWNGTLLDDVELSLTAINVVLERYGLSVLARERYLEIFTFPVVDYYKTLGFDFNRTPFSQVGTEFIDEYTSRMLTVDLNPGAREFLEQVRTAGLSQSLLSAAKVQMLETLTRHHRLREYFLRIVGLDNHYANSKLAAGQAWMRELGFVPAEILYIGDTIHDVDVAGEIGVDIVLLALGHTSRRRLAASGKPLFADFAELSAWFRVLTD